MRPLAFAGLVVAAGLATWVGGWLGLLLLGAAAPLLFRAVPPALVGLAAALAWAGLLAATGMSEALGRLLARVGGMFFVPGWSVAAGAVTFAFLLGWSAAALVAGLRRS